MHLCPKGSRGGDLGTLYSHKGPPSRNCVWLLIHNENHSWGLQRYPVNFVLGWLGCWFSYHLGFEILSTTCFSSWARSSLWSFPPPCPLEWWLCLCDELLSYRAGARTCCLYSQLNDEALWAYLEYSLVLIYLADKTHFWKFKSETHCCRLCVFIFKVTDFVSPSVFVIFLTTVKKLQTENLETLAFLHCFPLLFFMSHLFFLPGAFFWHKQLTG